ncbi:hypothetical protein QQF64_008027 [Cirrhinus molitorella]|uniref:Uncharacterized protein n=1 Tax=Cirrhinus molitorella TaxID=172907 RepID=A0ABR3M6G0_9TELE
MSSKIIFSYLFTQHTGETIPDEPPSRYLKIRVVVLTNWKFRFSVHPTVAHNSHPQNGEGDLRSHLIKNAWHCFSVGFNGPIIARTNSNETP